ncbi:MAG: hypothetical protein AAFP07_17375 [Cyanobacteria bacterium J06606_4]
MALSDGFPIKDRLISDRRLFVRGREYSAKNIRNPDAAEMKISISYRRLRQKSSTRGTTQTYGDSRSFFVPIVTKNTEEMRNTHSYCAEAELLIIFYFPKGILFSNADKICKPLLH